MTREATLEREHGTAGNKEITYNNIAYRSV